MSKRSDAIKDLMRSMPILAAVIRDYSAKALGVAMARIAEIETQLKAIPAGPPGEAGARGEPGRPGLPGPAGATGEPGPALDVEAVIRAILARLPTPQDGRDGKDADPDAMRMMVATTVAAELAKAVAALPAPQNGHDGAPGPAGVPGKDGADGPRGRDAAPVDPVLVRGLIVDEVARVSRTIPGEIAAQLALVPKAIDGKDGAAGPDGAPGRDGRDGANGRDADPDLLRVEVAKAVAAIPAPVNGKDGRDGAPGVVDPEFVRGEIAKAVALIPKALDGAPGSPGADGRDGKNGAPGRDIDPEVVRAEVARAVALIPKALDGKDGANGKDGRDAEVHPDALQWMVTEAVAKALAVVPKSIDGKDGRDGRDGRDALEVDILPGLDLDKSYPRGTFALYAGGTVRAIRNTTPGPFKSADWAVIANGVAQMWDSQDPTDPRVIITHKRMTDGVEVVARFRHPVQIYRGIWRHTERYERGDTVTYDGSSWHCNAAEPTDAKPGDGSDNWTLQVKHGRDGRTK